MFVYDSKTIQGSVNFEFIASTHNLLMGDLVVYVEGNEGKPNYF